MKDALVSKTDFKDVLRTKVMSSAEYRIFVSLVICKLKLHF